MEKLLQCNQSSLRTSPINSSSKWGKTLKGVPSTYISSSNIPTGTNLISSASLNSFEMFITPGGAIYNGLVKIHRVNQVQQLNLERTINSHF